MRYWMCLALLLLASCTKKEGEPSVQAGGRNAAPENPSTAEAAVGEEGDDQVRPSTSAWGEPGLRLLSVGEEPRVALRRSFARGETQKVGVEIGLGGGPVGQRLPTPPPDVRFLLSLATQTVSQDGSAATVEVVVEGAEPAMENAPAWLVAAAEDRSSTLKGARTQYSVDALGRAESIRFDLPSGQKQKIADVETALMELAVPFPEEPVGQGARWTYLETIDDEHLEGIQQRRSYELVAVDGSKVELKATIERKHPAGSAVPADLWATGVGEATWDLADLAPVEATHRVDKDKLRGAGGEQMQLVKSMRIQRR